TNYRREIGEPEGEILPRIHLAIEASCVAECRKLRGIRVVAVCHLFPRQLPISGPAPAIPSHCSRFSEATMETSLLIGAEFQKGLGAADNVRNPRTGEVIVDIPGASN